MSVDNKKRPELIFKNFSKSFVFDYYSLTVITIVTFTFLMIIFELGWIVLKVCSLKKNTFLLKITIEDDTEDLLVKSSFLAVTD